MYIIAQDGSGDFTTIQAAIDAVPAGGRSPTLLLIRPGEYRERVVVNKDHLRLVGEDRDRTVITHSACARDKNPDGTERGTFLSFTMLVTGRNVEIDRLTIRNDAGDGDTAGQAVAVYAAGDRGVWRDCRLIACQDTLFCGPLMPKVLRDIAPRTADAPCVDSVGDAPVTYARQYFEHCFIQGDVDFIFGPYRCWFEGCTLYMNARGGWYTAANTPQDQPHGLVFHRCRLTGACPPGRAYLGRPWRKFARTVFLHCDMDACVAPEGFRDWDADKRITSRCGEFGTTGVRADQSTRHPAQKRLTEEDAMALTVPQVLGGFDGWRPDQVIPTWFLCGDSTMADYPAAQAPMMGWGQTLPALLPEGAFVQNCAVNGRSSKSFVDENRLHFIDCCLRPGDRLVVSFSHNDEKPDPARHTDPEDTFPAYLSMYVDTARKHGAEPILATPIARRHFDPQGRLLATHGPYPEAIRRLAAEQGLCMVDLERATMALVQQAGAEGSKAYYCHVPGGHPHYPDGAADNSHLCERGAIRIAALFLAGLRGDSANGETTTFAAAQDNLDDLISREDSVYR
ncbi:MAG: hypothetical protein IJ662_08145 [Clostridia bacterium]|nr:hypothetical protein [Clostridia bacterium]